MNFIEKRICFVGGGVDRGGAGKMLKFVANSCSSHFLEVLMLAYQKERPSGIYSNIKYRTVTNSGSSTITRRIYVIRSIRKTIKDFRPDVVCAFTSECSVMARLATLGLDCKFVSAERADPYTLPLIWKAMTKITYRSSDACFFQLEKARDFYGKSIFHKSYVIPNPFILPQGISPFYGNRKKTIVSAGRFVKEKGFDVLIDAFYNISNIYPDYKLVLYGDGPLKFDYLNRAEKYGILSKVELPGYVSNVAEKIREDGIFVLTSRFEGIPNVLIEALSVGIPTVSTDCTPGGPRYLTDNGNRGLLVPVDDSKALADTICRLIEDEALYHRLEKQGPEIRDILMPSKIEKEWIDAFEKIIEKKR